MPQVMTYLSLLVQNVHSRGGHFAVYLVPNRFGEIGNENGTHAIGIKMACSDLNAAGKKLLKGHLRHVEFHNKVGEDLLYYRYVYYNCFNLEFMLYFTSETGRRRDVETETKRIIVRRVRQIVRKGSFETEVENQKEKKVR